MPKIKSEWRRFEGFTAEQLYELLRFRQDIFVVEQKSPYPDLDGFDQSAWHLLLRLEHQLCGYLRLVPRSTPSPLIKIGRVAVWSNLRRRGFGRMLMQEALHLHSQKFAGQEIVLGAQAHLSAFYAGFGFEPVGEPYDEFGVRHIAMKLKPRSLSDSGQMNVPGPSDEREVKTTNGGPRGGRR
jgi:ElaA protein